MTLTGGNQGLTWAVYELGCVMYGLTGSDQGLTCAIQRLTYLMQELTCAMQELGCAIQTLTFINVKILILVMTARLYRLFIVNV